MKASATHIRISPRKVRMVVDTVRGKSVSQALSILGFTRKKAALPVQKLLKSAVANAVENGGINDVETLVIDRIMWTKGPHLNAICHVHAGEPRQSGSALVT